MSLALNFLTDVENIKIVNIGECVNAVVFHFFISFYTPRGNVEHRLFALGVLVANSCRAISPLLCCNT